MYGLQWIMLLTFPKDLHMLSSRIGRRLKRPSYIWMVLKLMVKLSGPSLHYLRERRLLLLPKLLLPHRGEIPQNLRMLLWMVMEMEENVQKMFLLGENNSLRLEGDLLYHEEDLPDESKILHPYLGVELILHTDEVTPRLVGEGLRLLAEAVHLPLRDASGHHQGHLREESVVVLFVDDLLLHLGDVLQDVLEVLQEGLLLVADAVALQLGGQLVRHHDHPLLEEVGGHLLDVPKHHLILHHLVRAGVHEEYHGAVVLEGL